MLDYCCQMLAAVNQGPQRRSVKGIVCVSRSTLDRAGMTHHLAYQGKGFARYLSFCPFCGSDISELKVKEARDAD